MAVRGKKKAVEEDEESSGEEYKDEEDTESEELVPMAKGKRKSVGASSGTSKRSKKADDSDEDGETLDEGALYTNASMQPQSLAFLAQVAANNDRDWFHGHKDDYTRSRKDYESFVMSVMETLMRYDPELPQLEPNDVCFRLHRDIRFSNDKTPYKTHYASVFSRTGKKGPYAGYYIVLRSGSCRIGAGYFPFGDRDTTPRKFQALRDEIANDSSRLKSRLCKIHRNTGERLYSASSDDVEGVVNEFIRANEEHSLKRCPTGYDKNHPDVKLLMLKSYIISRDVPIEDLYKLNGAEIVGKMLAELTPWVHYLNRRLVDTRN